MIISFVLLGKFIEEKAKNNSNETVNKLIKLRPKEVTVLRNGIESKILVEEVNISDIVIIKPGEQIAIDGKVKEENH